MSSYQQRPQQSPELAPVEADLDLLDVGKVLLGQVSGGNGARLDLLGLRSAAETSAQRGQVELAREAGRGLVDGAAGFAKGGVDLGADLAQVRVDPLSTLSGLVSMNAAIPAPINPFRAGRELLQARAGEGSYSDALRSLVDPSVSAVEDQTFWRGVGQGALQPYEEAWSNGKPPLGYPNLAALAERYAGEVGFEELMEVFTSQGVSALGDALKARGRGNGIQLRVELHQAMEKDLEL